MSAPVFLDPQAADAQVGDVVEVRGDEARHAVTVQRREVGDKVDLVDGRGQRVRGTIVSVLEGQMSVHVDALATDDDPEIVLVQALAKGGRDEQAVEAAVELGVTRIVPWSAHRSIVQWRGAKVAKAHAKWQALVAAATKQSRRARLAQVDPLVTTGELFRVVEDAVQHGARVLVLHESATQGIGALPWADPRQPVWLIVGPEGGIDEDELDRLLHAGAQAVVLGPHVLRASSAGPAAIAALAIARGTWTVGATVEADEHNSGGLR